MGSVKGRSKQSGKRTQLSFALWSFAQRQAEVRQIIARWGEVSRLHPAERNAQTPERLSRPFAPGIQKPCEAATAP